MTFPRPARIAIGLLIGAAMACGRIGFDSSRRGADDAVPEDGATSTVDGSGDAGLCNYLPSCMMGEVTCCTATSSFCTVEGPGACPGTITRCSVFTQQGCPTGWACCITTQRPEPSCYSPVMPQPC